MADQSGKLPTKEGGFFVSDINRQGGQLGSLESFCLSARSFRMKEEWKIYHNPRCSKSREALSLLQAKGIQPLVREYLLHPLSETELLAVMDSLGGQPAQLVRVKEESFLQQPFDLTDPKVVARELALRPALLERPIVSRGSQAIIARPPARIEELCR